jgi:hypothetical protein
VDFSKNKDVKDTQRHLLAAVVRLRSKNITEEEFKELMEYIDYATVSFKQAIRVSKPKAKVKYFD